jgi:hypothetical protein
LRGYLVGMCRMVCWVSLLVLPSYTMRQAFASEILTLPLHWVWSHRHLRVSINVWVEAISSNVFIVIEHTASPSCYILRRIWYSSLDLSASFSAQLSLPRVLYSQQSLDRACDGSIGIFWPVIAFHGAE